MLGKEYLPHLIIGMLLLVGGSGSLLAYTVYSNNQLKASILCDSVTTSCASIMYITIYIYIIYYIIPYYIYYILYHISIV